MRSFAGALGFVVLSVAATANADVQRYTAGVMCEGLYQNWQYMYREERGIANFSTTSLQGVVCPARSRDVAIGNQCFGGTYTMSVDYDDETNTDDFWCEAYKVTFTGTMSWTAPRYTCSAGACPDPTEVNMGTGTMTLPSLQTSCVDGTFQNFGAICNLPRRVTPGTSFVLKVTAQTPS